MSTARAFPRARPDRQEPFQSVSGPAVPALPTVRLWPFALEEITPGDRRAVSPFLNGPAIIDHIYINAQNDNTNPKPSISLFYGPSLIASGNAVVPSIAQLGVPIFTDGVISTETANTYQQPVQHITKVSGDVLTLQLVLPVRFPITLDQFQLLIQMGTQTAGSQLLTGYVRILERVPPELLANFL